MIYEPIKKYLTMKKPEPYKDNCPICNNSKVTLEKEWFSYVTKNNNPTHWEGDQWFYKCVQCKAEFTTSESDTISMEQMKKTAIK